MKKLDDLPKGKPNTYDEVMKALAILHKGVLKQAALYGGKNSKLHIPQVVEGSLLKSIHNVQIDEEETLLEKQMPALNAKIEELADHLTAKSDSTGMGLLMDVVVELTKTMSTINGTEKS